MDKYFEKNEGINGYYIQKKIGEGRYGIAYLAINNNNEKCVVKQLKNEMIKKTGSNIIYEEKILKNLNSPYFPKFISSFNDGFRVGYLIEYIEGTPFYNFLLKNQYMLSRESIYKTCEKLLLLIETLQSYNIVHRDIRLPNVIIKNDGTLALIDFGLARFIDNNKYSKIEDYFYLGDFLIHLYYLSYDNDEYDELPWFDELDISLEEITFLKRLMGIERPFKTVSEIRKALYKLPLDFYDM